MLTSITNFFGGNGWATIDGFVTIVTLIFVMKNYFEIQKQNKKIDIYISENGKKIKIPSYLLRKHFTRAEIKGVLREVHKAKDNEPREYLIEYMQSSDFMDQIQDVYDGKRSEFVIPISENDRFHYTLT